MFDCSVMREAEKIYQDIARLKNSNVMWDQSDYVRLLIQVQG
jgi:hypothetical protein